LSQNDFSQHSLTVLCTYLKHENGWKLRSLVLDRNNIYDGGLQLLAVGLFERYQIFENNQHANRSQVVLPIQYLGLSDTKFTDHGFKYLMQRFEAIYLRNLQLTRDYEQPMEIDLSRNSLTEVSMKYLADILRKFQGFKSISLSGLSKMPHPQTGFVELARSLRDNHSLQRLDLSRNSLS
jgi:hypothetical protein